MARTLALLVALTACAVAAPATYAGAGSFPNPGLIQIPGDPTKETIGPGFPYPSAIEPTNLYGPITDVNVTLNGLIHPNPDDLDILVAGSAPAGSFRPSTVLMSDACGITDFTAGEFRTYTFDQQTNPANNMTDSGSCAPNVTRPVNFAGDTDDWPNLTTQGSTLDTFNGGNALTEWSLYVRDDALTHSGELAGGWSLSITTGDYDTAIPTFGPAVPYPRVATPGGVVGRVVTDVNVILGTLYHARVDDVDVMLEGPGGQTAMLMSDTCGESDTGGFGWGFDDDNTSPLPDNRAAGCPGVNSGGASFRPTDHEPGESLPSPAPPGPYPASLDVFEGTLAEGQWKLWVADDTAGRGGFTTSSFSVELFTRPKLATRWTAATVENVEGMPATLTVERATTATGGPATVRVRTTDGTAAAGSDYDAVDQVVSFGSGEVSKTVTVPLTDDAGEEGAETFTVTLSEATGDALISAPETATVTIGASDPSGATAPPAGTDPGTGGTVPGTGGTDPGGILPGLLPPLPGTTSFNAFRLPPNGRCVRRGRRIRFAPTSPLPVQLTRTEVRVNGKRVLLRRGAAADDPFRLRMSRRRMRVVIVVTTADGRTLTQRRTYRRCR